VVKAAIGDFFNACAAFARYALGSDVAAEVKQDAADMLRLLPDDWEIGKDGTTSQPIRTPVVLEILIGAELAPRLKELFDALMKAPSDSAEEEKALDELIAFAEAHKALVQMPAAGEAYLQAMSVIFRGSRTASMGDKNSRGWRMMRKIVDAVPDGATVAIDGTELTFAEHLGRLSRGGKAALGPDANLAVLIKKVMEAPAATQTEAKALRDLIDFAKSNREFVRRPDPAKALERALTTMFGASAAKYLEDPSRNVCLTMMSEIKDYLPASTRIELGGKTQRVSEHYDQIRGMSLLKSANEAPIGSVAEREAARGLIQLLHEGVDFEFGSESFRLRASKTLVALAQVNRQSPNGSTETAQLAARWMADNSAELASTSRAGTASGGRSSRHPALPVLSGALVLLWIALAGGLFTQLRAVRGGNAVMTDWLLCGAVFVAILVLTAVRRRLKRR
jgi:hypothetical protein